MSLEKQVRQVLVTGEVVLTTLQGTEIKYKGKKQKICLIIAVKKKILVHISNTESQP